MKSKCILYFLELALDPNKRRVPFKCQGFHYSIGNKRWVYKCRGPKRTCLAHCMHAELTCNSKICIQRSAVRRAINLSKKMQLDVRRTIVFWSIRWRKATLPLRKKCARSPKKAVIGGLLEEALKDQICASQLAKVVGPPYLRNKQ